MIDTELKILVKEKKNFLDENRLNKITIDFIKKTVEKMSGIEDISIPIRKENYVELRCVYYKLCKDFSLELKNPTLFEIGDCIKRNHATVIHGLKKFDDLITTNSLKQKDVYFNSIMKINNQIELIDVPEEIQKERIKDYFRIKHIALSNKYREVVNKLRDKVSFYRNNDIVERISNLNDKDLSELEIKLDAFFKVKGI